ncbi:MAG: HEAT repeat domain-containing protein [Anaerolineales bacterium]|nr:HEAT repeat domain-containing protein [Anaerolineales bacterium]
MEHETKEIPFDEVLDALLDETTILNPRYLYRLSDLEGRELKDLAKAWPKISERRRQALLEDCESLLEMDYVLSFESISRMAINDPQAKIRAPATRILWESEADDLIPTFIASSIEDPDADVRACMATALGRYVYRGELDKLPRKTQTEIENRLLEITSSSDEDSVRQRALESLGYSSREEIQDLIKAAYHEGSVPWLASALFAMGRTADPRWINHVTEQFEHSSPKVRYEAARASGELEAPQAVKGLLELLADGDDSVRKAAVWSLSQIGGEGVFDTLEALMMATEDDDLADHIDEALDNLVFTEDRSIFKLFDFDEESFTPILVEEDVEAQED